MPAPDSHDARLLSPEVPACGEVWWCLGRGRDKIRLALLASAAGPSRPVAACIPLDATTPLRLRALNRLWRHLDGAPPPPDPLTAQRRHRLKTMLRALDGRADGAMHRQIAEALWGEARIRSEPWKTSSLRDATLRLVRDGGALVGGGYLALLGTG